MTPTERELHDIIRRTIAYEPSSFQMSFTNRDKLSVALATALVKAGYGPRESDLSWCRQTLQVFAGYDVFEKWKDGTLSTETEGTFVTPKTVGIKVPTE